MTSKLIGFYSIALNCKDSPKDDEFGEQKGPQNENENEDDESGDERENMEQAAPDDQDQCDVEDEIFDREIIAESTEEQVVYENLMDPNLRREIQHAIIENFTYSSSHSTGSSTSINPSNEPQLVDLTENELAEEKSRNQLLMDVASEIALFKEEKIAVVEEMMVHDDKRAKWISEFQSIHEI
ncbi:hypothetical protein QAD02_022093 [Eretmocerus hayati]|uniref:Uncharacterized protein n=1 Tax=Eretmocerus hayati TaxID=131215 RepID=A0ACC2PUI9_9HYME|nr:hypothetical protein QAD02_022093 [Eretmocerus hayati]